MNIYPDNINVTISAVISQTTDSQAENINNNSNEIKPKVKKNQRKRQNSLNLDTTFEKKTKYNINVSKYPEVSRLLNTIIERLDLVEDENNRLNMFIDVIKEDNKAINSRYTKLFSKHGNIVKEVDKLKQENETLRTNLKTVESHVTNINNDDEAKHCYNYEIFTKF